MTFDLLEAPVRVTWDLHAADGTPAAADAVTAVGRELVAAGVFFVTLEARPLLHPAAGAVLAELAAGGCRTLAVCQGEEEEIRALAARPPLTALFLDAAGFLTGGRIDAAGLGGRVERLRRAGCEPSLLLVPDASSIRLLPQLLAFCRQAGIGRIKLPNTRVGDTFGALPAPKRLHPEDIGEFRHQVGDDPLALHAGLALEVHDLFLWEILFPGKKEGRSEYGGCQAADGLAHVDAAARVHPCSSWPEDLGSLRRQSLAAIWESPRRRRIRQEIAAVPAGCTGCRDYPVCLGGCRGLGRRLNQAAGSRDPLCRGPR